MDVERPLARVYERASRRQPSEKPGARRASSLQAVSHRSVGPEQGRRRIDKCEVVNRVHVRASANRGKDGAGKALEILRVDDVRSEDGERPTHPGQDRWVVDIERMPGHTLADRLPHAIRRVHLAHGKNEHFDPIE